MVANALSFLQTSTRSAFLKTVAAKRHFTAFGMGAVISVNNNKLSTILLIVHCLTCWCYQLVYDCVAMKYQCIVSVSRVMHCQHKFIALQVLQALH